MTADLVPVLLGYKRAIVRSLALAILALVMGDGPAAADYPSKPITIIVPYAPGGGGDAFTRALAVQAQDILGTKIFVENRMGGGATIGVGSVARARADGYTLGFVSTSPVVVVPNFFRVPYDPATDLTYLSRFVVTACPMVVKSDSEFESLQQLFAYGRTNPGKLRWSTAGINGAPHIATEAALREQGIKSAYIPMQGSPEVMAGLLGGTLQMGVVCDYAGPLAAGDIRALVEIGREPVPDLPGILTFGELGYPLAPTIFYGLIGPQGLPDEVISKWNETMRVITASDSFKQIAQRLNGNLAYLEHADFQALMLRDIAEMRQTLKALDMVK
jgi:tripartite-type tricarboxylate transporter receptor subunit TctC